MINHENEQSTNNETITTYYGDPLGEAKKVQAWVKKQLEQYSEGTETVQSDLVPTQQSPESNQ